ncbi:MAG: biopolymer transporter ExbD [Oligoflexales bacterium]|nr:biopolymer transporter ExbD [Oligoflexales bacterium]
MASVDSQGDRLNLMPMLDIFSILITFLLMSFSADPINHDLNEGVELPDSKSLAALDEIPAIIVSKNEVYVNDKKVASIVGSDISQDELRGGQGAVVALYEELKKLAETNKKYKKADEPSQLDALTLEMDKGHNFKLLKRVMLSAQQAEFIAFKLMVEKEFN